MYNKMYSNKTGHSSHYNNSQDSACFYRDVHLNRNNLLKRVQKTYKKFQEKPLPPAFKSKLGGPSVTWRVFSRLMMAIKFADSFTNDCMIFSFEKKMCGTGQRLFLVAHPEKMWSNHRMRQREERCSYEVIRENYPCKLYFDLEFYTCHNTEKNGNLMTEIFIKCVIAAMYEQHNLLFKDTDFLWLDASNEEKFSCHLILQMKGIAFQNNIHAGTFVSLLMSTLRRRIEENTPSDEFWPSAYEIKSLLVKSKKERAVFFCDEGVYSKNRNFRLYLSTKQGKNSPLLLSQYNKYVPPDSLRCKDETIFYDSLITYFRFEKNTKLLSYEENVQMSVFNSFSRKMKIDKPGVSGSASSPFPDLDNFVLGIIKDGLAVGFIRKWTYFSNEQRIIYDIGGGYRYCGNIGRHHKSNNIKIIVDMKANCYYQSCLDPECRQQNYRSEAIEIPMDIFSINMPDDFFETDCFSQLQPQQNVTDSNNIHCSEELFNGCSTDIFETESCDITRCNGKVIHYDTDESLWQNWNLNFEDFSELFKLNNEAEVIQIKNNDPMDMHSEVQLDDVSNHQSWDAFFVKEFAFTEEEVNQEINVNMNQDFSFFNNEESWDTESSRDSALSLDNISFEDELMMAEAVEVVEATISEDNFSEETMF